VWIDVKAAQNLTTFDAVYCVKQAGIYWTATFQVWVSLHPEWMDKYETERRSLGHPGGYEIVSLLSSEAGEHGNKGNIDRRVSYRWPKMNSSASSGIYAAKVALEDGFDKIVLAGIPMDTKAGHFLPETKDVHGQVRGQYWLGRDTFIDGLEKSIPHLRGKVRSMSGYTAKVLGIPDAEWLKA
jgi:hypothetical protein